VRASAPTFEDLVRLSEKLKRALAAGPAVSHVEAFGSLSSGEADQWSDIDLRVSSEGPLAVFLARHELLRDVAVATTEWIPPPTPEGVWSTMLFHEESPYHKLDVCFAGPEGTPAAPLPKPPVAPCCCPPEGSMGHFVLGQTLGILRYLKARRRGHGLSCWRFAAALVDWVSALEAERTMGRPLSEGKLNTWEYVALDRMASEADAQLILGALRLESPRNMDLAVAGLLELLVAQGEEVAETRGEDTLPNAVRDLTRFVREELGQGP